MCPHNAYVWYVECSKDGCQKAAGDANFVRQCDLTMKNELGPTCLKYLMNTPTFEPTVTPDNASEIRCTEHWRDVQQPVDQT
jgi:hypothetical protein